MKKLGIYDIYVAVTYDGLLLREVKLTRTLYQDPGKLCWARVDNHFLLVREHASGYLFCGYDILSNEYHFVTEIKTKDALDAEDLSLALQE